MIELNPYRKTKVNLADYDYEDDIAKREMLSTLSQTEFEILEEILFSSLRFPISDLSRNLEIRMDELVPILEKLKKTKLFTIDNGYLVVDKEYRKYYELQLQRFEEDFQPGMDFLQQLLKNIPIHILPNWYHIPRTSDNIFHSLVEKYLITPQVFQRYLLELNFQDSTLSSIIEDLFNAPELELPLAEVREKYSLSNTTLQEYILELEYHLVCCMCCRWKNGQLEAFITPYKEWKDYVHFMESSKPKSIAQGVQLFRQEEYAFSDDMAKILTATKIKKISLHFNKEKNGWQIDSEHIRLLADALGDFDVAHERPLIESYLFSLVNKIIKLRLATIQENYLCPSPDAKDWMNLPSEKRALHTYKHPLNSLEFDENPSICSEKNIREIEKTIARVIDYDWVYLDEFLKGVIVPLNERTKTELKKVGKTWKYSLPEYSKEEFDFIKYTIINWLFESGIIQTGRKNSAPCFRVTRLGKMLFGE